MSTQLLLAAYCGGGCAGGRILWRGVRGMHNGAGVRNWAELALGLYTGIN